MSEKNGLRFETLALHGGQQVDETTSRGVPIYRTSSYVFPSTERAANLFALKELGNIYSRIMNPTQDVLEQRVSLLEGGAASVAFASGTAAIFNTIITIAKAGDEIVSANNLYGGTYTMFDAILPNMGITVKFVKQDDPKNFEKAITPEDARPVHRDHRQPRAGFHGRRRGGKGGSQARPAAGGGCDVHHAVPGTDHRAWGGHRGQFPDQVDGRPWDGHRGDRHGRGKVRLEGQEVLPVQRSRSQLPRPEVGARSSRGPRADRLRAAAAHRSPSEPRRVHLRRQRVDLPPGNRVPSRADGAAQQQRPRGCAVAEEAAQGGVAAYPLPEDPTYPVASRYLMKGFGGMVVFGIKGGRAAGEKFINSLKLLSHLANVGDAKSLALHPASTSHSQLTEEQQREGGLTALNPLHLRDDLIG